MRCIICLCCAFHRKFRMSEVWERRGASILSVWSGTKISFEEFDRSMKYLMSQGHFFGPAAYVWYFVSSLNRPGAIFMICFRRMSEVWEFQVVRDLQHCPSQVVLIFFEEFAHSMKIFLSDFLFFWRRQDVPLVLRPHTWYVSSLNVVCFEFKPPGCCLFIDVHS